MLVAKPEFVCARLVTRAASQPLRSTVTRSVRVDRSTAPPDVAATTAPSRINSIRSMTGWAADAETVTSTDPPARSMRMTSPGSRPSTRRSTNVPDETYVRPARTAAAHASNETGTPGSRRAYVRIAPSGISADILSRPPDDRQPKAAVQVAIPLPDRGSIHAGRERLHLDGVDAAGDDVRRDLRIGQGEMHGDGQSALRPGRVGPIGQQPIQRVPEARLRGTGAGHRQHGL